jgi:hypothetical protein
MDGIALARYRAAFHKTEAMRFTGNLDLHRTLERTLRRAGLPLAYTQGFHPHPRLTLASALTLGCTSEGELAEFWLETALPAGEVLAACQRASPSGIHVTEVIPVRLEEPALPNLLRSAEYEAELDPATVPDICPRSGALLDPRRCPTRREKPMIFGARRGPRAITAMGPRRFGCLSLREVRPTTGRGSGARIEPTLDPPEVFADKFAQFQEIFARTRHLRSGQWNQVRDRGFACPATWWEKSSRSPEQPGSPDVRDVEKPGFCEKPGFLARYGPWGWRVRSNAWALPQRRCPAPAMLPPIGGCGFDQPGNLK